jgi:hypothetical protein
MQENADAIVEMLRRVVRAMMDGDVGAEQSRAAQSSAEQRGAEHVRRSWVRCWIKSRPGQREESRQHVGRRDAKGCAQTVRLHCRVVAARRLQLRGRE